MIFKWLTKPKSNETESIQVPQLWVVRWCGRHGQFSGDTREYMEGFKTEQQAKEFAASLTAAFALLRHTSGANVTVSRN